MVSPLRALTRSFLPSFKTLTRERTGLLSFGSINIKLDKCYESREELEWFNLWRWKEVIQAHQYYMDLINNKEVKEVQELRNILLKNKIKHIFNGF